MITGKYPSLRLRRTRKQSWSRRLIQENTLTANDFILPIFLIDGSNKKESISTMPGVYRYTINRLSQIIDKALKIGIPMVALFPKTKNSLKNEIGSESLNENNLVCKAILEIKKKYKNQIGIMCDVALDPYTSHGHDGLLNKGKILNDETIPKHIPISRIVDPQMAFSMTNYILMAVLNYQRCWYDFQDAQSRNHWAQFEYDEKNLNVGVLGIGHLGNDAANALYRLGFQVYGYSNSSKETIFILNYVFYHYISYYSTLVLSLIHI